jgi:hypothetical protein
MAKKRLDVLLVERGLFPSREKAQAAILAGMVYLGDSRGTKAGDQVDEAAEIVVKGAALPYVSRGGLKLEKALRVFALNLSGRPAWTSVPPPAASPTACCKTARSMCTRWMWAMASWPGPCGPTNG